MWKVQLFKLNYDSREKDAVYEVLDSAWLTMGQKTQDFEGEFARFLSGDVKCLALSNCTAALHLALLALGIGPGDEVITPSLTFVADQNVVTMVGARNVLADVTSLDDWTMSPADIERRITPRTKAVIVMHYAGFACDMDTIVEICRQRGIFLIEDCAHSPGADCGEQALGTFGDVSAFSFFTNKNISVGEGGMVVTRNSELYERLKGLRAHGMSVPSFDRFKGRTVSYDVFSAGLNCRIDEIRSALGLVQLRKLAEANERRGQLVRQYAARLDRARGILIPFRQFSRGKPSFHIMPVMLEDDIDRTKVIESMKADGIQTSIHYPEIQAFAAYEGKMNQTPLAQHISRHELTLPLYPTMADEEVSMVCDALLKGIEQQK